ncbi:aminotransferase class V-fold PLP-dependent enzyme [Devosia sp. A8/3-2]|nr:aminotransferase class V-fold PLP-dependent enzyme [Devosia sp. A8/3-2]
MPDRPSSKMRAAPIPPAPCSTRSEHFYRATKVQPYGVYPASIAAGEAMNRSYERIARAFNVDPDWIHFGPSTSANTYVLANAFGAWLKPGDAIIVTNQDHEANTGNWRRLAARH